MTGNNTCGNINTGNITGAYQIGGLAGSYNDIINKSYNTGDIVIFSGDYVGGLIGFGQGKIYESYNTGNIAARTYSGQYVGGNRYARSQKLQDNASRDNEYLQSSNEKGLLSSISRLTSTLVSTPSATWIKYGY